MSRVQEFYKGQNVFVTGGTGFLGRVLVEKLLRSCPDIGTIYLMVREKKGKSVEERVSELVENSVFEVLQKDRPDFSKHLVAIPCNISEPRMGISAADYARIVDEVSVIFHLAATVRFDESFDVAIGMNVNMTKSIVDLAKECKNLKTGIYVSTAYSQCIRKTIDEKLYAPPMTYEEANKLIDEAKQDKWSQEKMAGVTKELLGGQWPNTYSFSKAIAEDTVGRYAKDIPFAIVRPSIVISSYNEPTPGWVEGIYSVHGMMIAMGLGLIHAMRVDGKSTVDLVPVDMVCNAAIVSAWETATTKKQHSEEVPVYNYVSGPENPVSWTTFHSMSTEYGHCFPLSQAIYYNTVIFAKRKWVYVILNFFLHVIPALLLDAVCKLIGKEAKYYKLYRKLIGGSDSLSYYCIREWNFRNRNVQNLWNLLDDKDKEIFPFDLRDIDWRLQFMQLVTGIRKHVLKERPVDISKAVQRQSILYGLHTVIRLAFAAFVLWIVWKLFCGWSFVASAQCVGA